MKEYKCQFCKKVYFSYYSYYYHIKSGCIKFKLHKFTMPFHKRNRPAANSIISPQEKNKKPKTFSDKSFEAFKEVLEEIYVINQETDVYSRSTEENLISTAITAIKVKSRKNPELDVFSTPESLSEA